MNSFVFICLITRFICLKITNNLVWSLTNCSCTSGMKIGWMKNLHPNYGWNFSMAMKILKK